MKKSVWFLGVLLLLAAAPSEAKRRYKYSINPNRAEEILAGIHLSDPISKDRWLTLIGNRKDDQYQVQPGDNLWTISQRTIGDPRLWRKIWAMNPELLNPHDINIGQILSYYREGVSAGNFEIPLVRLIPNRPGAGTDLDADSLVNLEIKNQYRPSFFVVDEEEFMGEVTGAYAQREWLSMHEEIYVKFSNPELAKPKLHFSIVKVERRVRDHGTLLGTLVRLVGEVEIGRTVDGLTRVEMMRQLGVVERGYKVIPVRDPLKAAPIFNPPIESTAKILMGDNTDATMLGQGQIVLVNRGSTDGMKDGYLFRVAMDTDPYLRSDSDVSPAFKGEVQLISVGSLASVGLILRNTQPLVVGDALVAAQLFPDRPPVPRRQIKEIEFD